MNNSGEENKQTKKKITGKNLRETSKTKHDIKNSSHCLFQFRECKSKSDQIYGYG